MSYLNSVRQQWTEYLNFDFISSAITSPVYNSAKILVPLLTPIIGSDYNEKILSLLRTLFMFYHKLSFHG